MMASLARFRAFTLDVTTTLKKLDADVTDTAGITGSFIVKNTGGATVYLGGSDMTSGNVSTGTGSKGYPLGVGESVSIDGDTNSIFAIVPSGTGLLHVIEGV